MAVSRPEPARGWVASPVAVLAILALQVALAQTLSRPLSAQAVAEPVLHGRVSVGDQPMTSPGFVILHHVSDEAQGEVDSARVAADGTFSFRLPTVPDPDRSDVYFASIRYAGILYFGSPLNLPVQLDSLYEIQAYDTILAPSEGMSLPLQARNVFLEQEEGVWRGTDLFQVRNGEDRTLVARDGGAVWRYPLPAGARNATVTQAQFAGVASSVEEGALVVREAIPPGERLFVVRYELDDPFTTIPLPGSVETFDVLVREPAPPVDVPGLEALGPVEIDPGSTYLRFNGSNLNGTTVQVVRGEEQRPPPVGWFAVLLALALAGAGVWAVQSRREPTRASAPVARDRASLILEIAQLDEAFQSHENPTPEERGAYEARRADLLRRVRSAPRG